MPRQFEPFPLDGLRKPDMGSISDTPVRLSKAVDQLKKPDQKKADAKVDAKVDRAAEDSFPASDPPSFNRGHTGRPEAERDPDDVDNAPTK